MSFLENDRLRVGMLNGTLLAVFACVWVSDRYPDFSLLAIGMSVVIVVFQAVVLCAAGRKDEHPVVATQVAKPLPTSPIVASVAPFPTLKDEVPKVFPTTVNQFAVIRTLHLTRPHLPRLVQAQLREEYPAHIRGMFWLTMPRPINAELAKWTLTEHDEKSFSINAGAFEIEHFHGRTNFRMLDLTTITVEGRTRGERVHFGSDESDDSRLITPIYN